MLEVRPLHGFTVKASNLRGDQPSVHTGAVRVLHDHPRLLVDLCQQPPVDVVQTTDPVQDGVRFCVRHARAALVSDVPVALNEAVPLLCVAGVQQGISEGEAWAVVPLKGKPDEALALGRRRIRGSDQCVDPCLRHVQTLDRIQQGLEQSLLVLLHLLADDAVHQGFLKVRVHSVSDGQASLRQFLHHAPDRDHAVLEAAKDAVAELTRLLLLHAVATEVQQLGDEVRRLGVHQGVLVRLNFLLNGLGVRGHAVADGCPLLQSTFTPIARSLRRPASDGRFWYIASSASFLDGTSGISPSTNSSSRSFGSCSVTEPISLCCGKAPCNLCIINPLAAKKFNRAIDVVVVATLAGTDAHRGEELFLCVPHDRLNVCGADLHALVGQSRPDFTHHLAHEGAVPGPTGNVLRVDAKVLTVTLGCQSQF